jgi:hypothetical protein
MAVQKLWSGKTRPSLLKRERGTCVHRAANSGCIFKSLWHSALESLGYKE